MAGLRLAVLFAFLYSVNGQTYRFDTGSGISQSIAGAGASSLATATGASDRRICYDGSAVLRTSGAQVLLQTAGTDTVEMMTPSGEDILGLACCCNLIAITYVTATEQRIRFKKRDQTDIFVDVAFRVIQANPNANSAVMECNPTTREILVLSLEQLWRFNIDDLAATPDMASIPGSTLFAKPTCVSSWKNGNDYHIYVSTTGNTYVDVFQLIGFTITTTSTYSAFVEFSPVEVICVDYDQGGDVHLLTENAGDTEHYILGVATTDIIDPTPVTNPTPVYEDTTGGINGANGIDVCGTACVEVDCADNAGCTCAGTCGFCLFDSTTCQCDNSLVVGPCFYSAAAAPPCEQCLTQLDAQVLIYNPLAKRREGEVKVYGVLEGTGAAPIARAVRVGRFGAAAWPLPNMASAVGPGAGNPVIQGFDAPVPNRLRGSRFGVYLAEFNSDDAAKRDVNIPAIVTENSGFTNALYTTTVNSGMDVTLEAAMTAKLLPFVDTLKWMFTPYDHETKVPGARRTPSCTFGANRLYLYCTLAGVTPENDEGVYEVFRPRRERRNWHPIYFLFVRQCTADNEYGAACTPSGATCENGIVDDDCGYCVCAPGWQGAACDVACGSPDQIGSSCGLTCSAVFAGATDCVGVKICRSGRLGCACRSGLQPPECQQPCDAGFWGSNCLNTCDAACAATCDPIDGNCP